MQWRHGSQPENVQNSSELQRHSQKNLCDIRSVGGHHTKVHNDLNEESRLHCESHIEDFRKRGCGLNLGIRYHLLWIKNLVLGPNGSAVRKTCQHPVP